MEKNTYIKQLQRIELMILKDISKICDENGLKYYLIGGTLLGAVRHKGFIPWDDDIDIVMFRNEYNKLFEIIKNNYSDKYFAQKFETDKNYTRYVLKIRLNGTKHIENGVSDLNINQGIYIDVFPLDYIKGNTFGVKIRGILLRLLFALKNIKHRHKHYKGLKKMFAYLLFILLLIIPDALLNYLFDIVCTCSNNKKCDFVTNFASHFKWKKQMFPTEYYSDGEYLWFENEKFRVPREYKKILERLYGNYMKLPKEEERVAHDIVEVDFGKYGK